MPLNRRRPLRRAAMVGDAGYAVGRRLAKTAAEIQPAGKQASNRGIAEPAGGAGSEPDRVDDRSKLESLGGDP